jgi:nucleoside-diphosphate-sugar epimerase
MPALPVAASPPGERLRSQSHRQRDITLARDQLDWGARVALRDGLRPKMAYFEALLRRV